MEILHAMQDDDARPVMDVPNRVGSWLALLATYHRGKVWEPFEGSQQQPSIRGHAAFRGRLLRSRFPATATKNARTTVSRGPTR